MSWIKRNLFFVIGSGVAMILLGLAGYYLYAQWSGYEDNNTKLEGSYAELTRIAKLQPNPGNEKVDNIAIAKEHKLKVRAVMDQAGGFFTPVLAIPPGTNISSEAFKAALQRTVDELTRNAISASVTLQPKYPFSFAAQQPLVKFAPGSLGPLATELGEVRAICDVLFKAKINMLYNLRRPRVSEDDSKGPQSDYLEISATTNELAILSPYEVTFYGFSGELASVLAGFANDRHGFFVTTLNVEPGTPSSGSVMDPNTGAMMGEGNVMPGRYPGMVPPPMTTPAPNSAGRGGLPVVLDERQLKVTMGVIVVKLQPKK